jgi:hypothetical protein
MSYGTKTKTMVLDGRLSHQYTHRQQLFEDMTSLGTNFETHANWQGNAEEPTAKDFVGRKAHTITSGKVQGTH